MITYEQLKELLPRNIEDLNYIEKYNKCAELLSIIPKHDEQDLLSLISSTVYSFCNTLKVLNGELESPRVKLTTLPSGLDFAGVLAPKNSKKFVTTDFAVNFKDIIAFYETYEKPQEGLDEDLYKLHFNILHPLMTDLFLISGVSSYHVADGIDEYDIRKYLTSNNKNNYLMSESLFQTFEYILSRSCHCIDNMLTKWQPYVDWHARFEMLKYLNRLNKKGNLMQDTTDYTYTVDYSQQLFDTVFTDFEKDIIIKNNIHVDKLYAYIWCAHVYNKEDIVLDLFKEGVGSNGFRPEDF